MQANKHKTTGFESAGFSREMANVTVFGTVEFKLYERIIFLHFKIEIFQFILPVMMFFNFSN